MTVSPELHALVLKRDGVCFCKRLDDSHTCRDRWGNQHSAYDLSKLTVDHVHLEAGGVRGKRAPDDAQHLIAMCHGSNVAGPSRAVREAEREYLRSIHPV